MTNMQFPYTGVGLVSRDIQYPTEIMASMQGAEKLPGGVIIDPNYTREIRVGELLARDSSSALLMGRKSTELSAVLHSGGYVASVDDAHNFEVGEVVCISNADDSFTIASINYALNQLTFAVAADEEYADDDRVWVNTTARGTAVGIAAERYTPNVDPLYLGKVSGRTSMWIAGTFYKNKLAGSGDSGIDVQGNTDLGGIDVPSPVGLLYRIR